MSLIFSGTSIDDCLEKASEELNISKELLQYNVIKDSKIFFKRKVKIEVIIENKNVLKNDDSEVDEKKEHNEYQEYNVVEKQSKLDRDEVLDYGIKIENHRIIVKESDNSEEVLTITPCEGITLFINDEECNYIMPVTESDKIEYTFNEDESMRNIEISVDDNKMNAYLSIRYIPKVVCELEDKPYCRNMVLEKKVIRQEFPEKYSKQDIITELNLKNVSYGIDEYELDSICNKSNVENILIAKGTLPKDDEEDQINILFANNKELVDYNPNEKVDYRKRYSISNVKAGEVIAERIEGEEGHDGINVYGEPIKRKIRKHIFVKAASGCVFKENKVIATIEGKPSVKGNVFNVNRLYKVDKVDLESGNIEFIGDVEILGTVNEGMEIDAGNEVFIGKNVESAIIKAGGNINIYGNVIKSDICAGCENVKRNSYLETLKTYQSDMQQLISVAQKMKNDSKNNKTDGEIVKLLMENKFKCLPESARKILSYNVSQGIQETQITTFIIKKLIGRGPLKIKDITELNEMQEIIKDEIEEIQQLIITPTTIQLEYAQGSNISASGDVILTGKGQYVSDISAVNNIEFTLDGAVCRGGTLKAGNEIKLKTVGSIAGVSTILKVPKNGKITADIAYNNTIFCFGEKKLRLDVSGKNVEAYMDKSGEIIIDKFIL